MNRARVRAKPLTSKAIIITSIIAIIIAGLITQDDLRSIFQHNKIKIDPGLKPSDLLSFKTIKQTEVNNGIVNYVLIDIQILTDSSLTFDHELLYPIAKMYQSQFGKGHDQFKVRYWLPEQYLNPNYKSIALAQYNFVKGVLQDSSFNQFILDHN